MGLALYSPSRGDPLASSTDFLFAGCLSVGRTALEASLHAACLASSETIVPPVCDCQDPPPRRLSPPSLQRQGAFRAAWTAKSPRRTAVLVSTSRRASAGDDSVLHTGQPWSETKNNCGRAGRVRKGLSGLG